MVSTTVFIISPHLMFKSGLESLLGHQTRVTVAGRAASIEAALDQIKSLNPPTIILDSDEVARNDLSSVVKLINANPNSKIIGLSLRSNRAYIYHITEKNIGSLEDLLQLIDF